MNKIVNGILIELTPEEEAAWLASQVISIEELKYRRISELASIRYQHETSGITLNGVSIRTDRESQGLINGAWSTAQIKPAVIIDFKGANDWVEINATQIIEIASAVSDYVQACFRAERLHTEAIAALETSEAVAAYDLTTGWP